MISFLNPLFLAFGAAVLIPLVLHMIQSSRTVRLPFSTVRFLKVAQKRSSSRIKMENFLLWFLRTLLMALLTLAFAMPILRTRDFGGLLGRAARDVAVVIDSSYSMEYRLGRQTAWNQATDLAASIIEGLGERDRFCVYLAGDQVTPICEQLTDKREETAARIRALKPPTSSSQLCPATLAALGTLNQETRRTERELHIITDGQQLPWAKFKRDEAGKPVADTGGTLWDPTKVNDRTTTFVSLLGAPAPENVAPVDAALEPRLITPETPCEVTVKLSRTGPPMETAVTLYVDDQEFGRRSVMLGSGASTETRFMLPPQGAGVHVVRIETPEDNLAVDNAFHLLIRAKEKLPALCVGSKENTMFLLAALSTAVGGVSPIEVKPITADALAAETLSSYACILLCNALPLSGQQIKAFEQYVSGGGLLVLFPGDRGAMGDYAAWASLPSVPAAILDIPVTERKRLLSWDKPQHPIVAPLREGALAPTLAIKRQLKCDPLNEKAETLVSTGAGFPFLVSRPVGRGVVLLFTVSADRSWSDFPLSPFFLPMVQQVVFYAAGVGAGVPFVWTTDSLSLPEYLPEATRESVIKAPDGKPVPVRSAVVEGETVTYAEGLTTPGIYTLGGGGKPEESPALAVNMPRPESDLTPLKAEDIPAILGVTTVQVANNKEELFRKLEEFRVGKTLGEPFLWLALLIALIESFYANWLTRKGPKLTDSLTIDPSGKVKDKD